MEISLLPERSDLNASLLGDNNEVLQTFPSFKRFHFDSGVELFKQGDSYPYITLIEQGKVKLTTTTLNGKEVLIDLREAGEFVGHDLASPSNSTLETARSLTSLIVCRVHVQEFRNLLAIDSVMAQKVIKILATRERRLKRKLELTNGATVEARLAYAIQQLSDKFDELCEHGYGRHIRVTHQELADMVGASRPTVSLILNKLRQTGILNYNRNYICVENIDGIVKLLSHSK